MTRPAVLDLRDGRPDDGGPCAAIYRPYVTGTAVTFETTPPTPSQMSDRIAAAVATHAWLICEDRGEVVGYAYATAFSARSAYRWACDVSVYSLPGRQRTGIGTALYGELLPRLAGRGYRIAVARMSLPNDASVALHRACGFEPAGIHRSIGYKNGRWHDVASWQRILVSDGGPPPEPC